MKTVSNTSASSNVARQAYVDHICSHHKWHEFATLTFQRPLTSFEQLERAKQMFHSWLHERYFDHAEILGDARKTISPKYYDGEWESVRRRDQLVYRYGNQGDPITKTRRWWDRGQADYEGDDKGWRVDQVQDYHVNWSGQFVKRWKRYKHLMSPIYILGVERHKSGSWHIHSVIHHRKYADTIRRDRGWQLWFSRFGRASITPVKSQADVAGYVSKYCVKDYYNVDPRREAEMILSDYFGQQPRKVAGHSVATASAKHHAGEKLARPAMRAKDSSHGLLFPSARYLPQTPVNTRQDLAPSPYSGGGVNKGADAGGLRLAAAGPQ